MPNQATIKAVEDTAREVAEATRTLKRLRDIHKAAILAAAADGHGDNEIVRRAQGGLSRRLIFELLGAQDVLTIAQDALTRHGLRVGDLSSAALYDGRDVAVWRDSANQVRIQLTPGLVDQAVASRLSVALAADKALRDAGLYMHLDEYCEDMADMLADGKELQIGKATAD
jgi:hypothetical protein